MIKEFPRWEMKKKKKDESLGKDYPKGERPHLLKPELKIKGENQRFWWMYMVEREGWIYFFKISSNLFVENEDDVWSFEEIDIKSEPVFLFFKIK